IGAVLGKMPSDVAVVDIDASPDNIFRLDSILDLSDLDYLQFGLQHTPEIMSGTVYYVVSEHALDGISSADDLVAIVMGSGEIPDGITVRGQEVWHGASDKIFAGLNDSSRPYYAYAVLEYRGVRLLAHGILNN